MVEINNKILFAIIAFGLILIGLGYYGFATENLESDAIIRIGVITFVCCGTYLLAKNGKFIQSDDYRFTRLGIALFIAGLLMSIMHWSYGKEIMFIGYLSIPLIYLFHLIKNKRTKWTDFLKFFLVLSIVLSKSMSMFHIPFYQEFALIAMVLVSILLTEALIHKKIAMDN